ncbi:MAG: FGGY-family carbohydrate kinase [Anaerolineae bacterium]|nr:FGGY-family carbohydrate kinase [Anaerolineae bacterium]
MKNYVLAHDLGTTGNKATLYDADGKLVGSAFYAYNTQYAFTGWAEQNPEDWWQAVCASTQKLLQQTVGVRPEEIACITFSGQMMGCVPIGKDARPLRNAIIWADQRAVDQQDWVAERIAPEDVYRITGHRLSASYSLAKVLWLRDHQPDTYKATYKFVHAKDSIVARLTGKFVTEPSDGSSMNLYDLETGGWSEAIIQAAELNPDQLPEIKRSIDVVGELLPTVATEIGLPAGTPVVIGGGDGSCAAVGAGVIAEGSAYNYIGSSSWIAISSSRPIFDPEQRTFTFAHLMPGMFMPTGTMQAAGASYQWTRDQLCPVEVQAAQSLGISSYEIINLGAEKSPVGANGLLYLPYLMGERSPRWNPRARGAFIGLTIRHTRADMVRAVLEGITLNLRVILESFTKQGAHIDVMRVIGGGARGRFWNRIMADVYGMPVQRLSILEEATSMGAAVAGGVGVGLYKDFSIIEQMNHIAETIQPNPVAQAAYDKIHPIFEASYQALLPIYDMIAEANA